MDDIDYYAAGILENSKPGAILGHTFQCVVGEMFFRWKFGDRFYYEFDNQPGSFSLGNFYLNKFNTVKPVWCGIVWALNNFHFGQISKSLSKKENSVL